MKEKIPGARKNPSGKEINTEESCLKGLGFCSHGFDSDSSIVDVKNGKIVRIRPLHFDWKYDPEAVQSLEDGSARTRPLNPSEVPDPPLQPGL